MPHITRMHLYTCAKCQLIYVARWYWWWLGWARRPGYLISCHIKIAVFTGKIFDFLFFLLKEKGKKESDGYLVETESSLLPSPLGKRIPSLRSTTDQFQHDKDKAKLKAVALCLNKFPQRTSGTQPRLLETNKSLTNLRLYVSSWLVLPRPSPSPDHPSFNGAVNKNSRSLNALNLFALWTCLRG